MINSNQYGENMFSLIMIGAGAILALGRWLDGAFIPSDTWSWLKSIGACSISILGRPWVAFPLLDFEDGIARSTSRKCVDRVLLCCNLFGSPFWISPVPSRNPAIGIIQSGKNCGSITFIISMIWMELGPRSASFGTRSISSVGSMRIHRMRVMGGTPILPPCARWIGLSGSCAHRDTRENGIQA